MARLISREFNPAVPVVVRRFFVAAGRHWNPGDRFDWRTLSIAQRRVKQMFDAGKLMHPDDASAPTTLTPADLAPVADTPVDGAPAADTPAEVTPAAAPAAEVVDDLTDLNMNELREIADQINAPLRVSREKQREAIREARRGQNQ